MVEAPQVKVQQNTVQLARKKKSVVDFEWQFYDGMSKKDYQPSKIPQPPLSPLTHLRKHQINQTIEKVN